MAKVKRRYHAPVRTEQAAQTRQRILQAAAEAFAQRGWAGTTIAGLAREASVTAQAVHLSADRARSVRRQDCQRLLDLTGRRRRPLRDQLTDLLFVQSGPGVHADLVGDRHWSNDAYQSWLATAVENLLA